MRRGADKGCEAAEPASIGLHRIVARTTCELERSHVFDHSAQGFLEPMHS